MIPVIQSRIGTNGNCMAACLASILEMPLASVPDFSLDEKQFYCDIQAFLQLLGLYYVQVAVDDPMFAEAAGKWFRSLAYHRGHIAAWRATRLGRAEWCNSL